MIVGPQWMAAWIALAGLLLVVQLYVTPGYGRHRTPQWGVSLPNRLAWIVMEMVALGSFWWGWWWVSDAQAGEAQNAVVVVAVLLWNLHYLHRGLVYPLRTRTSGKRMPAAIMLAAVAFNLINGWLIGSSLGLGQVQSGNAELLSVHTLFGCAMFALGAVINLQSDNVLLALRRGADRTYHIPRGGLFEHVSCPNFLGEILQWCGFAVLCWNLPALAFAVWTASNLVPRALAHHRWYLRRFADYPANRRALVPKVL